LMHICNAMATWRAQGKLIRTAASFRAASAAALLLSLGEMGQRQVLTHSSLLFHHVRVDVGGMALTSRSADQIVDSLRFHDTHLIGALLRHIESGLGGLDATAAEGRARCALISGQDTGPNSIHLGSASGGRPKWLAALARVYEKSVSVGRLKPYADHIHRRFEVDSAMDLGEAYALLLIDNIRGMPDLVPAARTVHRADETIPSPPRLAVKISPKL